MVTVSSCYSKPFIDSARHINISPYLWHHEILPFILSYAWNHTVYITILPKTTNHKCKQTPQCILHTLMHCCLHSETMISFNVGRKCRFCDWNATFDASICFAAMVTKTRHRREQEQASKPERGDSDDQVGVIKKTNRMKLLSAHSWHIQCMLCQMTKCMSVHWEYCRYIYQHPALLVCFTFVGICHSSAETQQAHCLLLRAFTALEMYYISKPGLTNTGMSKSEVF